MASFEGITVDFWFVVLRGGKEDRLSHIFVVHRCVPVCDWEWASALAADEEDDEAIF
jgi:hypothetical protein